MKNKMMMSVVLAGGLLMGGQIKAFDFEDFMNAANDVLTYANEFESTVYQPLKNDLDAFKQKFTDEKNRALASIQIIKNKSTSKQVRTANVFKILLISFNLFNELSGQLIRFVDVAKSMTQKLEPISSEIRKGTEGMAMVQDKIRDVQKYADRIGSLITTLSRLLGTPVPN
ncbi:MAG: hypothetical protein NTX86_04960 [Candidatus Dependentiae bacterium]|nr:hypothetical protein [Candidatus Dependentiae bacterium]